MSNDILSLQQTSADSWQAKYNGNYGTYNIKIKTDGKKVTDFSCSCPSDYYPCKHIAIIKSAIDKHIEENKKTPKDSIITIDELLKEVNYRELVDFTIKQAKYNPEFTNAFFLEFIHKSSVQQENNYAQILRKALKKVHFDMKDIYEYHDESVEIDVLDEWLKKAEEHLSQNRFEEAIAICKACIEEYAEWLQDADEEIADYVDPVYEEKPFAFLRKIASNQSADSNKLYQYCKAEMLKKKYAGTEMYDSFNNLLAELANTENNAIEFIALQDNLLKNITDKSSYSAEKIIVRKIAFYKKTNQPEKAIQLVEENIQIENFRKQLVEKKISEKKNTEAKKLISDFLSKKENKNNFHYHSDWNKLLLNIAQKEKDIPVIRKVSFGFIENYFHKDYYRIYKSSFASDEWKIELEKIIKHYIKLDKYFSESVADILAEEKDAVRLMNYIEKYLTAERMEKYYSHFAPAYRKETLELFRKAINEYAEKNTGRNHYEYIVILFHKISRLDGGKEMVSILTNQYKDQYKNRRAMIEILNKMK